MLRASTVIMIVLPVPVGAFSILFALDAGTVDVSILGVLALLFLQCSIIFAYAAGYLYCKDTMKGESHGTTGS